MDDLLKLAEQCSFCWEAAVTTRADENDIFPACEQCAAAWDRDPGFTCEHKRVSGPPMSGICLDCGDDGGARSAIAQPQASHKYSMKEEPNG